MFSCGVLDWTVLHFLVLGCDLMLTQIQWKSLCTVFGWMSGWSSSVIFTVDLLQAGKKPFFSFKELQTRPMSFERVFSTRGNIVNAGNIFSTLQHEHRYWSSRKKRDQTGWKTAGVPSIELWLIRNLFWPLWPSSLLFALLFLLVKVHCALLWVCVCHFHLIHTCASSTSDQASDRALLPAECFFQQLNIHRKCKAMRRTL